VLIIEIDAMVTVHHRTEADVFGDTRHSHTAVEKKTMRFVVESERETALAEWHADHYAGNAFDENYKRLETRVGPTVNGIVQPLTTRIMGY
jgi:hypothetical protein